MLTQISYTVVNKRRLSDLWTYSTHIYLPIVSWIGQCHLSPLLFFSFSLCSLYYICLLPRLHADIVMSLEDICGCISSKTGRIRTKLGRGMWNGERVILYIFWRARARSPRESREIPSFLRDEYHPPVWSLTLYRFSRNLAGILYVNHCLQFCMNPFVAKFWKFLR